MWVLPACLLAGCRADKEQIQFSSEPPRSPVISTNDVSPPAKKLARQDLLKIDRAVFGYLLQRHFWDDNEYSAVFVEGSDEEVETLIRAFPNHIPPIKTSERADLVPNRTPVDKDTGRPAMILSVTVLDPLDDTVEAIGKWYAGAAVSGFYTFSLKKSGDEWLIEKTN